MTGISPITIGLALAALTILVLALFMKRRLRAPKRPEPWEKAAIMKQLLELSEQDGFPTRTAGAVRSRAARTRLQRVVAKRPSPAAGQGPVEEDGILPF